MMCMQTKKTNFVILFGGMRNKWAEITYVPRVEFSEPHDTYQKMTRFLSIIVFCFRARSRDRISHIKGTNKAKQQTVNSRKIRETGNS